MVRIADGDGDLAEVVQLRGMLHRPDVCLREAQPLGAVHSQGRDFFDMDAEPRVVLVEHPRHCFGHLPVRRSGAC